MSQFFRSLHSDPLSSLRLSGSVRLRPSRPTSGQSPTLYGDKHPCGRREDPGEDNLTSTPNSYQPTESFRGTSTTEGSSPSPTGLIIHRWSGPTCVGVYGEWDSTFLRGVGVKPVILRRRRKFTLQPRSHSGRWSWTRSFSTGSLGVRPKRSGVRPSSEGTTTLRPSTSPPGPIRL